MKKIIFTFSLLKKRGFRSSLTYFLYVVGYYKILPASIINSVLIKENNEPLMNFVQILENEKVRNIIFSLDLPNPYSRNAVCSKLIALSKKLEKENLGIFIHSMYRDLKEQTFRYENRKQEVRDLHKGKNFTEEEIENIAKKFTAKPSLFSPHIIGSALDLCFYDLQTGKKFSYGTEIREMGEKTPFDSRNLTKEEQENRKKLRNLMESFDFVCYPGEWWHYSYGDQAWAAYRGERYALYGGIEKI